MWSFLLFYHRVAKLTQNSTKRNNDNSATSTDSEAEASDTEEEKICTVDPATNQTIIDPVKNSKCGHSYERSSITRLMKKPGMLCPAVGCVVPLKEADIVDDLFLKEYLKNNKDH